MANNVSIPSAPVLHSRGEIDAQGIPGTVYIEFPLRWENSWRSRRPNNHDGVWVFAKAWDGNEWTHVYLSPDSTRHHFGVGAGAMHRQIHPNSDIGVVLQESERNLMAVELGFTYAQLNRFDLSSPWTREVAGVFIHRVGTGRGTVNLTTVNLFWPYERQGFFRDDQLAVKVFAIEMVFIPEGHFYIGCSGTDASWAANSFTSNESKLGHPFRIDSEDAIELNESTDETELWAVGMNSDAAWHTGVGVIPRSFPKGHRAFWVMKHEVTQEAYAEFLNTLNFVQQDAHTGSRNSAGTSTRNLNEARVGNNPFNNLNNGLAVYRNHLVVTAIGDVQRFGVNGRRNVSAGTNANGINNFSGVQERPRYDGQGDDLVGVDGQDLAMHFVSWFNLLAYAEFTGLRPMTEFEYEKICRGPIFPVAGEFAWGSVNLTLAHQTWMNIVPTWSSWYSDQLSPSNPSGHQARILNFNSGDERFAGINSGSFNAAMLYGVLYSGSHYQVTLRAVHRVGCFADSATTRQAAGATFWGVMNMTDNVNEMVVNATHSSGFVFNGHHGTGNVRFDGGIHEAPDRVWPTAVGSFFAKGFAPPPALGISHSWIGGTFATYEFNSLGTVAWHIDAGRVSNRSGVTRLSHFQWNDAENMAYMGGIRLVRTQHWLQTSRDAMAAATSDGDGDN